MLRHQHSSAIVNAVVIVVFVVVVLVPADSCGPEDDVAAMLGTHTHKGVTINLTRGDYAPLMKRMEDNLKKAKVMNCVYNTIHIYRPFS